MQSAGEITEPHGEDQAAGDAPRSAAVRAGLLFVDFFLIITAYYQLKPASRSLFIEYLGADRLPYVWIATAVVLGAAMALYHHLVERYSRFGLVLGTSLTFAAILVGFRILMARPGPAVASAFYIFVDIFSVVLVEQFWSLTNSLHTTEDGKRWYGLVGAGGLCGGVAGGGIAAAFIELTPATTADLLLVAAAILLLVVALTVAMARLGLYRETSPAPAAPAAGGGWRVLAGSRYLLLVALLLLLAQLAQPIIDFQFMKTVERVYVQQDARTSFLSLFFSVMGLFSIAVNLAFTPLVHRLWGVIAGLFVQPLVLGVSVVAFVIQPSLGLAAIMKIADRGLSYSINRASRELLYVPIAPRLIYQAKAWIDMFGYRLFKVIGSALILLLTQVLPWPLSIVQLSTLTMGICLLWLALLAYLQPAYQHVVTHGHDPAPGAFPR